MSRLNHRSAVWTSASAHAVGCRCSVTITVVHDKDGRSISTHRCSPMHDWAVKELEDIAKAKLKAALKS